MNNRDAYNPRRPHHLGEMVWISAAALLFCLFLPAQTAGKPDISFRQLGTPQDLSNDLVTAVLQGRRGFIWIATHHGLNRYDGHRLNVCQKGTGLGLAISREIVIRHEGSIDVTSQEEVGTVFTIRLPQRA